MHRRQAGGVSRREFLGGLVLVGAAGLLGLKPELVAAEPPPETTRIRLNRNEVMSNSVEIKFGSNPLLDDSCLLLFLVTSTLSVSG